MPEKKRKKTPHRPYTKVQKGFENSKIFLHFFIEIEAFMGCLGGEEKGALEGVVEENR